MIRTASKTWKTGKRKTGKWKIGKWKIGKWKIGKWKTGKWKTGKWKIGKWKTGCLETKTPQTFALGLIIIDHYIMIKPESTTSIDHSSHEDYEDGRNVQSARLRNHVLDCVALFKIDKR